MKNRNTTISLVLFLLGIFMGAIDSGIVSPAREIIQNGFGVTRSLGMWMVTLYTLSYAVSMPIVSKMADRHGHKRIYTMGIVVFGLGSLLCGLANFYGSFTFFLAARMIQAIGAGGIIPIATAVIGHSFPIEQRGTALGLVGGIYGVATILGPTLGSTILSMAGNQHWGWIFFINVPISLIILSLSGKMAETKGDAAAPLDILGAVLIAGFIGSLMYALTNLNFFHVAETIGNANVFPFLIASLVLLPLLIVVERRAQDPILNLKYFSNRQMVVVFLLAFVVGTGMMGMVFVPQFAENVLKLNPGKGGYLVTLLAVFSGFAAPLSGTLIDRRGARFVMALGFSFTITGTLVLGYLAAQNMAMSSIIMGLAAMGFGVGFTMGAPLNYLVLALVPQEEGASALATMSLIRSIGVTISPSIMIGFIVEAAKNLQANLMSSLQEGLAAMMPKGMSFPMGGGTTKAAEAFAPLQSASVTDIVDRLKGALQTLIPAPANAMVIQGVEKMRGNLEQVFQTTMNSGYTRMFTAAAVIALVGFVGTLLLSAQPDVRTSQAAKRVSKANPAKAD